MMERKEIIKNVLIIFCVFVLFAIPWASFFGIKDPGLLETATVFLRTGAFLVLTGLVTRLIYQIYYKPLAQEMKDEESRETDQKEKKQLLFKPTIGGYIGFLFMIFLGISFLIVAIFNNDVLWMISCSFLGIGFGLYFWYLMPVFVFAEDSVQIRSHLLYLLGIDRKTVIKYADITSVSPDAKMNGTYGVEPMHRMMITSKGKTETYGLICYNPDIIAKIWLRFKEKLGNKVKVKLD
ncbi:MAG: hypothetical protein JW931_07550 [Methanomicrobiaceae archaeon]|nr:hypothetical protein [Methanomicrobiaceae archaeon]